MYIGSNPQQLQTLIFTKNPHKNYFFTENAFSCISFKFQFNIQRYFTVDDYNLFFVTLSSIITRDGNCTVTPCIKLKAISFADLESLIYRRFMVKGSFSWVEQGFASNRISIGRLWSKILKCKNKKVNFLIHFSSLKPYVTISQRSSDNGRSLIKRLVNYPINLHFQRIKCQLCNFNLLSLQTVLMW